MAFLGGVLIAFSTFLMDPLARSGIVPISEGENELFKGGFQFFGIAIVAFSVLQFYLEFGSISLGSLSVGPVKLMGTPSDQTKAAAEGDSPGAPAGVEGREAKSKSEGNDDNESPSFEEPSELSARLAGRLEEEIELQSRRANTNLALGIMAALTGMAILGWLSVITADEFKSSLSAPIKAFSPMLYWGSFSARLALSVAANIFAFFFFTSYRRNLSEVRYFHNELTNIQSRLIAVGLTNSGGPADLRKLTIKSLIEIERNFILRKGETTAEVAMREHDRDDIVALAQMLSSFTQAAGVQVGAGAASTPPRRSRKKAA